jgi:hypothetical protein
LTLALAFVLGPSVSYAEEGALRLHQHHHYVHHRHATTPKTMAAPTATAAPIVAEPLATPADRERKEGVSRDPENCVMGCLDNTQ